MATSINTALVLGLEYGWPPAPSIGYTYGTSQRSEGSCVSPSCNRLNDNHSAHTDSASCAVLLASKKSSIINQGCSVGTPANIVY